MEALPTTLSLLLSVFWPQPRQVTPRPQARLQFPVQVVAPPQLARPAALLQRELTRYFGTDAVGDRGGTVIRLELVPRYISRPEEYALEVTGQTFRLAARDEQGAFWAVHSLVQLLGSAATRRSATGCDIVGVHVRDWPESNFRAFMIQGAWTAEPEAFRQTLEVMARLKIRYFALEFGPQVVLDLDPSIAERGRFSKAQARELVNYGRSLGMEPIGYLNLLGHLDRAYKKPPYTGHGGVMIQNDETYERFVYPILSEMLEVYGPIQYFHAGMDEAWELFEWFSSQGMNSADLVARHVERVNAFLKARGVKLVIWHDMFFHPDLSRELGAPVGPANGGPPQNTAAALERIPREVILNYWYYSPRATYPALDYLLEKGFEVWASPWQSPFSFARYAQARGVPVMGTLWSGPPGCWFSRAYGPVTALYAQAAWHPSAAPDGVTPEPGLAMAAQRATEAELWRRSSMGFSGTTALLIPPGAPSRAAHLSWPRDAAKAPEQHAGVPLDFSTPALRAPLPPRSQPLTGGAGVAYVVLRGTERVLLDGVNTARGESQLVLYTAPQTNTGTN
ncbi:MAG: glycoside hydrolase family 20 zincin-like fold domain-containing protein, partial [Armatimonadota bacterium]|nr:glycoside hydrolase family 20 zincin-like fold domain-containing protein [Armatimonadota bacterium]